MSAPATHRADTDTVTSASPLLWLAREVATWNRLFQAFLLFGVVVGIAFRLIPGTSSGLLANVLFIFFTLPLGLAVAGSRIVLATERAVLRERGIA